MSDAAEQPPHDDGGDSSAPDPLAGDWSEGLPGPLHASGIPPPKLLNVAAPAPALPTDPAPEAVEVDISFSLDDAEEPAPEAPPEIPGPAELTAPAAMAPPIGMEPPADVAPPRAPAAAQTAPRSEVVAEESIEIDLGEDFALPPDPEALPPDPEALPAHASLPADPAAPFPPTGDAPTPWSEPTEEPAPRSATPQESTPEPPSPVELRAPAESWGGTAHADAAHADAVAPVVMAAREPAPEEETAIPTAVEEPTIDEAWNAVAASAGAEDWKPDSTSNESQRSPVRDPTAPIVVGADWSTMSKGPDWAPAEGQAEPETVPTWEPAPPSGDQATWSASAPAATAATDRAWDAAVSAAAAAGAANDAWNAPDGEPAVSGSWDAASAAPPARPAWNSPAVGASALEQLDSEPPPPEPGAAAKLFGQMPQGFSLAGDDDEAAANSEPAVLSDEDANLLVPIDEAPVAPAAAPQRVARLAAVQPVSIGALHVAGEHRVAVHMRGGGTRRGSVRNVDLSKSSFLLHPQGGDEPETIYHGEVKAVFFMLSPGDKARKGDGKKVKITFVDGRSIDGHRDGADAKQGFFLVPNDAARTNTWRIYVAREALSEVKDG